LHLPYLLLSRLQHSLVGVNLLVKLHQFVLVCREFLFKNIYLSVEDIVRANHVIKFLVQPYVDLSFLIDLFLDQINSVFSPEDILSSSCYRDVPLLQTVQLLDHLAHVVQPLAYSTFIVTD